MEATYSHLIINLMIVSILIIVVAVIVKKLKLTRYINNPHIKIVTAVSIGHKERLILVQVKDKQLLLGATSSHIETLQVFDGIGTTDVEGIDNSPKVFADYFKRKG